MKNRGLHADCGHFDFLDEKSFIQSSVCDVGNLDDKVTKEIPWRHAFHADQTFRTIVLKIVTIEIAIVVTVAAAATTTLATIEKHSSSIAGRCSGTIA